jgi:HSP20 family protein
MRLVRYSYPSYRAVPSFGFQRSPWAGLEHEIDRLFTTALTDGATAARQFPVDLYEDKANTYVRAELPGVNRDDINVEMADGALTITATRKTPAPSTSSGQAPAATAEQATNAQAEESFSFSRSVTIADEVQTDKVTANYENGVLTVTLPKREEVKPKKIAVAVK